MKYAYILLNDCFLNNYYKKDYFPSNSITISYDTKCKNITKEN